MQSFRDNTGHSWNLVINLNTAKAVRAETEVDLLRLDEGAIGRLVEDPETLIAALWTLCKRQAEAADVSPELFAERLVGDVLDEASEKMLLAIADFFPKGRGDVMRKAVARMQRYWEVTADAASEAMDDTAWEAKQRAKVRTQILGPDGTPSPGPSEWTLESSPSGSSPGSPAEPPATAGTTPPASSP